ncbi:MAG: glycosyltransferase family 4 protein [Actinomycetota bacterium]|nr:glycosyltransferase family 4 protein [Actinomycetota bacterium]
MRVALVCPYAWDRDGGVQSHVRSLAEALRARSHDVTVLAPYRSRPPESDNGAVRVAKAIGVPANGSVAPIAFGPLAAAATRRALRTIEPEVIHLHEPLIPSVSLLALWNANAPLVGTFHAAADASYGYRLAAPVLQRAARKLAVKTAVSDAARDLISRYIAGDYALTPNGVDTRRFAEAEPLLQRSRPTVLFLGRIERRKGLEVLIQAMTRLRDLDAELVVAGSGPEERAAKTLAERLQVAARFLGRVADEDVPGLYRSADVYCAPGLGGESFGIVLVEAMAAGVPVVCSDLSGFRAVAGGAATLVPPGQAGPLADAIREALTDERRAAEMRKMSALIAQAFDWGRLVDGVEAIYARATPR